MEGRLVTAVEEAKYIIEIKLGDRTFTTRQSLPVVQVNAVRRSQDRRVGETLAKKIYYAWRQTSEGKVNDDGIPFTYRQLTIRDTPSQPEQPGLFDE